MKAKIEIERLAKEYGKLAEPWVFVRKRESKPSMAAVSSPHTRIKSDRNLLLTL